MLLRDLRLPSLRERLERHRLQLRRSTSTGASSRRAPAGIDEPVVGAHAGGYNLVSIGIAVLGSFMSVPISAPARSALERLLAWKLSLHGVPAHGQRDRAGQPGGRPLQPLSRRRARARCRASPATATATRPTARATLSTASFPGIRPGVRRLAGRPARATLSLAPLRPRNRRAAAARGRTERPSPQRRRRGSPAAKPTVLTGSLAFLDGTPIAGAPVDDPGAQRSSAKGEVVSERTIAEAVTEATGAVLARRRPSSGRARRQGCGCGRSVRAAPVRYGAAVSEPLQACPPARVRSLRRALPRPRPQAAPPPAT